MVMKPKDKKKFTHKSTNYFNSLVMIHPNNPLKQAWDMWIMFLVIYTMITVPLTIGYGVTDESLANEHGYFFSYDAIDRLNAMSDWCFGIDTVLVFCTSYIDELGDEVIEFNHIAYRYVTGFFWIDFLSVVPFDLIISAMMGQASNMSYTSLLKALKIPRLLRLSRVFKKFEELSIAVLWRVFRLVFTVFIFVHIFTCILGLLFVTTDSLWFHKNNLTTERYWYYRYIVSSHAIAGMLFGNSMIPSSPAEFAFGIITTLFGGAVQASIIGSVSAVIASAGGGENEFRNSMDTINHSMRQMNLDVRLIDDVRKFFNFQHAVYGNTGGRDAWTDNLSPGLQVKIMKNKYFFLLVKVS